MEVNIFTYDGTIILDEVYDYLGGHEGLFKNVISNIKHLEDQKGKGSGANFKSLKEGVDSNRGINICEIKSNGIKKEKLGVNLYHIRKLKKYNTKRIIR